MKRDKIACNCSNVTYGKIEDAIKAGAKDFKEVREMTGCAKTCGKCGEFIKYLVRDLLEERNI